MDISIPSLNKENKVFPFFVESLRFKNGRGECLVTGLVDNSIIESVQVAISVIKKFYNIINISKKKIFRSDFHVHFTDGSFYKEGTSAGLGILISLIYSCMTLKQKENLTNLSILATGEIDLYGNILEVGGINEKMEIANNYDYFLIPQNSYVINNKRGNIIELKKLEDLDTFLKQFRNLSSESS